MKKYLYFNILLFIGCLVAPPWGSAMANEAVASAINQRMEELLFSGDLEIGGAEISARDILPEFYARRAFEPVWTSDEKIRELGAIIASAPEEGLEIEDYYQDELRQLAAQTRESRSPADIADLDILLTESLIRSGYHRRFGKVNARLLYPSINFKRALTEGMDPEAVIQAWIDAGSLQGFLDEKIPRGPLYRALQNALVEYRAIEASGGWPAVPAGPTMRKGDSDARVVALRRRLSVTGDLPTGADAASDLFDDSLVQAVINFQERHALGADGLVGEQTVIALNVPVQTRIDQLRLSLERLRWVFDEVTDEFVAVNIAGFRVFVVRDREFIWVSRAMVGKTYRQTPVFRGDIRYLEMNPTWTVPPGIMRNDILPAIKRDPGYLQAKNMSVIDRNGKHVDPATVDWQAYTKGVPYTIRQEPGPNNALGTIKFIFPNEHFVFLHDTPSRGLFTRDDRAFSSGCIRVEDPLALAEIVLNDPVKWNRAALEEAVAGRKTMRVNLTEPMPVLILYLTAMIDPEGRVRFLKDVYGRDQAVLEALNRDVIIDFSDLAPAT